MKNQGTKLDQEIAEKILKDIDNFVFDCDGVLWEHGNPIAGSAETVLKLVKHGKKVFYITNNSTKTQAQLVEKCKRMGFPADLKSVMGTAYASAHYLKNIGLEGKVFVVGGEAMGEELTKCGIPHVGIGQDTCPPNDNGQGEKLLFLNKWKLDPEVKAVLVGFDPHHSFRKMVRATSYATNRDNLFLATNEDPTFPSTSGICIPGTGSIVASVSIPSRRKPLVIGKPETTMFDLLQQHHGLKPEHTMMVGDRLASDMMMASKCGLHSLFVLSGGDKLEDLEARKTSDQAEDQQCIPEYYADCLGSLGNYINT